MKREKLKKELLEFITMIKAKEFGKNPKLKRMAKDLADKSLEVMPTYDFTQYQLTLRYLNNIFPSGNCLKEAI